MRLVLTLLFAVPMVAPADAQVASFDCGAARTAVERAICSNPPLGTLDTQLADLYRGVRDTERESQRAWLRLRNECGGDVGCLTRQYSERIAQLRALTGAAQPAPQPAPAAHASASPIGVSARGGPADQQPVQTAQLSSADRQQLIASRQQLANTSKSLADEADRRILSLMRERNSIPGDRFRDQAKHLEEILRGASQELRQALPMGSSSQNIPELRNEETLIQQSLQRLEANADRARDLHTPPEVQAQIRQMEQARQASRSAWENYSRRPKTLLEQVLNYTCSGLEEGNEFVYWISGANGQNQCVLTQMQGASRGRQLDIRSFNERGFRIFLNSHENPPNIIVGDERNSISCSTSRVGTGNALVMERLQRAWGLAFRECPGVRSAF